MTTLVAPAKLTWFLEVTGRREDGYHELRSEMSSLELADVLEVDENGEGLSVAGPYAAGVPRDGSDLVTRALALVARRAGVHLVKSIPVGGGLGGGSADAAAILRWAGGVSPEVALQLGGDVPFCQVGGHALVEGVGERVSPLPGDVRPVTVMWPNFPLNTGACYRAYDEMIESGWRPRRENHLEEPAVRVEPRLGRVLAWLRSEWGHEVSLAGSGSSMFVAGHVGSPRDTWDVEGPEGPVRFCQTTTAPRGAPE
ncbi:MAG TPA: 4-(cytidine 5'-diphospho)-2-C-methyl-D-erythritol kinase [Acidimicrobiales bacterium]|nr:4-(cytidine 5'-diphospho)-2-C-methyl-D-erythritol kinase [Acidimicrobiales bacterium]